MDYTSEHFWPQLKQLALSIDGLDYFQILNLPAQASSAQIRDSYYQMARALHPDKFFHIGDVETKAAIGKIYKRITESYTILKDEAKRMKYLGDIQGPERMSKLRYSEASVAEQREQQKQATKIAKTPRADQMVQAALVDMANQRWDKAFRNVQSAVMLEPTNVELKKMLDDLDKRRKAP